MGRTPTQPSPENGTGEPASVRFSDRNARRLTAPSIMDSSPPTLLQLDTDGREFTSVHVAQVLECPDPATEPEASSRQQMPSTLEHKSGTFRRSLPRWVADVGEPVPAVALQEEGWKGGMGGQLAVFLLCSRLKVESARRISLEGALSDSRNGGTGPSGQRVGGVRQQM